MNVRLACLLVVGHYGHVLTTGRQPKSAENNKRMCQASEHLGQVHDALAYIETASDGPLHPWNTASTL